MARIGTGRFDPTRAVGGVSANRIEAELSSLRSAAPPTAPFSRGVVVEYIGDVSRITPAGIESLSEYLSGGTESLNNAPRNSVIVTIVAGEGSAANRNIVCYPFFPPHMALPVKPGEQVWIMMETPSANYGYWICRVTEINAVDDVNYTHSDRRFDLYLDKVTTDELANIVGDDAGEEARPFDGLKDPEKVPGPPGFFNGPVDDDESAGTLPTLPGRNSFDDIVDSSFAYKSFVPEPVPRYTKRPGDLVIQGSNNALICLGQDRGWNALTRPDQILGSNAYTDVDSEGTPTQQIEEFCGTIDIVSGRGRFFENTLPDPDSTNIPDTQPRVIANTRGNLEVDKNPAAYINDSARRDIELNRLDRPQEGDPDFLTDASRIYVSMKTNGDVNFNIAADVIYPAFEGEIVDVADSPFIVMKSDEIRIIARKETERGTINGGIRIIKEGALNDDAASVYLLPSGIVQISGAKIYIGQPDQGAGPGEKGSEPYVKYSELEKLLNSTYDALDQFCTKLLTHVTPGYGNPSPQINQGASSLQQEIAARKQEVPNLKSTRIFGE